VKFERSKIVVDIYGEVIELTSPTVAMLTVIQKAKEGDPVLMIDHLKSLLVGCGMKQETLDAMEADHMNQLIEYLVSKKK
jgi:hypothetical protein